MLLVQCNGCKKTAFAHNHQAPDAALDCECCPGGEGHPVLPDGRPDHAAMANSCAGAHDGPCAAGTAGCAVCRPVTITVMPGDGPRLRPAFDPAALVQGALEDLAATPQGRAQMAALLQGQGG